MLQFKTEQMRLFEESRDRNRSESRPRRRGGEGEREGEKKRLQRRRRATADNNTILIVSASHMGNTHTATKIHTCPCRSVLSSMRAHVSVWAPSADGTEQSQRNVP